MQLKPLLERAIAPKGTVCSVARAFLDCQASRKRFAIGKNTQTLATHHIVPLTGVIDDFAPENATWHNIPLLATRALPKDALIVNCSSSISPINVLSHLAANGFRDVINYCDLVHASRGKLELPDFAQAQRVEMQGHVDTWQELYDQTADDVSQKTVLDILRFRLTADPIYMKNYSVRTDEQYFEAFMGYRHEIFVDAGAYNGDTASAFAHRFPDYRKILLFEPSVVNMTAARNRLANTRDVSFFPIGLSDVRARISFNADSGSASKITLYGDSEIIVDRLDAIITDPVSAIKMDVEGWELPALRGSVNHIRENKPKLAIAVYHKATDLRDIFIYIKELGVRYDIFVRHYTQGWSETVIFFRPRY